MEQRRRRLGPPEITFHGRPVFYGWWVVAAGSLLSTLVGGFYIHGFAVFLGPLAEEFDVGLRDGHARLHRLRRQRGSPRPHRRLPCRPFRLAARDAGGHPPLRRRVLPPQPRAQPPRRLHRGRGRHLSRGEYGRLRLYRHGGEPLVPSPPGRRPLHCDGWLRRRRPPGLFPPVLHRRVRLASRGPRCGCRDYRRRLSRRVPPDAQPPRGRRASPRRRTTPGRTARHAGRHADRRPHSS